ncbi:unnamed protein product [Musa acuminata subsp. malaccensis]|uniref:(wild Malaysian banana) hypothetical protein n=1 Tax=Musa acuminata subsp. malaccensis TaxID=214687 RepID=A0A804HZC5_MUSAM|nr:unnamed protein product [Musa acuminata subsp. malaccensis]
MSASIFFQDVEGIIGCSVGESPHVPIHQGNWILINAALNDAFDPGPRYQPPAPALLICTASRGITEHLRLAIDLCSES